MVSSIKTPILRAQNLLEGLVESCLKGGRVGFTGMSAAHLVGVSTIIGCHLLFSLASLGWCGCATGTRVGGHSYCSTSTEEGLLGRVLNDEQLKWANDESTVAVRANPRWRKCQKCYVYFQMKLNAFQRCGVEEEHVQALVCCYVELWADDCPRVEIYSYCEKVGNTSSMQIGLAVG